MIFGYRDNDLPETPLQDFSANHPEWVRLVLEEAFRELHKAFKDSPVDVRAMSFYPNYANDLSSDQAHQVYVAGNQASEVGITFPEERQSHVYYKGILDSAKTALGHPGPDGVGWVNFSPVYPPSTPAEISEFVKLLRALGRGIGRIAAHEIGHQLEKLTPNGSAGFPNMNCGSSLNPCPNGDNFVYNFRSGTGLPQEGGTSKGGQFFYIDVPGRPVIHWTAQSLCWFKNYLVAGSCQ